MRTYDPDRARLEVLARDHRDSFASASPFPHVVIDNFLPEWVIDELLAEFPSPGDPLWSRYVNPHERKLASKDPRELGDFTRHVLERFNSAVMVGFLEDLTGVSPLVVDPWFEGGGVHQIERGGFLKVHADFNRHKSMDVERRLNAIVYLNRDWDPSYGGELELWNDAMTEKVASVAPIANRLIVFATSSNANHGHPDPLACPPDRQRRSMALYYYTTAKTGSDVQHWTLFRQRPAETRTTLSRKDRVKRFIPPVAVDAWRAANARRAERSMGRHD